MTYDREMIYVLKDIVKELHELNRKLDRFGQASIFSAGKPLPVQVEMRNSIVLNDMITKLEHDQEIFEESLPPTIPNSQ